jgi:hypothetical protein
MYTVNGGGTLKLGVSQQVCITIQKAVSIKVAVIFG